MPTYEYLCQTCHHRFETWQKMMDEPLTACPQCGSSIRRVLYPAGIVFKGSGFYKTDHAKGAPAASNEANGEAKKTESNGESKEATSEGKTTGESKAAASDTSSSSTKPTKSSDTSSSSTTAAKS